MSGHVINADVGLDDLGHAKNGAVARRQVLPINCVKGDETMGRAFEVTDFDALAWP